jgi:hypothetical protein
LPADYFQIPPFQNNEKPIKVKASDRLKADIRLYKLLYEKADYDEKKTYKAKLEELEELLVAKK